MYPQASACANRAFEGGCGPRTAEGGCPTFSEQEKFFAENRKQKTENPVTHMARAPTPEVQAETRKRRRERLLIAVSLLLVVVITSMEVHLVHRGGQPLTGSLLAFGLLNLNTFLLLLFTFLIFRHLSKLFLERRQRVFGARLRTRLVLTFISLTLLPVTFLFVMAWQLITSRADFSLDAQVEQALSQALELQRAASVEVEGKLRAVGHLAAQEAVEAAPWASAELNSLSVTLKQLQQSYQLTALELLDPFGAPLAGSATAEARRLPGVLLHNGAAGAIPEETLHRRAVPQGEALDLLVTVKSSAGKLLGYVAARQLLPQGQALKAAAAAKSLEELRQRQLLFSPVKVSHYLTLIIVTLVAVMAAIWLAFYMAREITTPIRELAEGALKVADGHYDFRIAQEGRDEIGFLVQSFNKMTQDLKNSQEQLAEAYRQLSASHALISTQKRDMEILLQNVAAGVIGVDVAGRVILINDSAVQMLRLNRDEVLGQDCRSLLPQAEYQRMVEVVAAARRSAKGTVEKPLHLVLPDQVLYLMVKATALRDEAGQDLGVVIVFEDLSELERAQRLEAWREVARRIAHEVKNPLTPIKLAAQRLQRRYAGRLGEEGAILEECTGIIVNQADELKNLVNEFSRFARLPQLTLAPQDLNALVQETLNLYREARPRVRLEFQPAPELPPLLLDGEQVKRLLLNLMDNALAAIPGEGAISISLAADPHHEQVCLTVADTGVGIPDRDKVRIFEPYFSTRRGGTGLGLAIVNSIVAEHQGHIRVEDNSPQGAKFIIHFPMHQVQYAGHAAGS
jgi:two-component system nitrogen regulation sensor histidine kinase NtrY